MKSRGHDERYAFEAQGAAALLLRSLSIPADLRADAPCQPVVDALQGIAVDLTTALTATDRYARLLDAVRRVVPCDAAALLIDDHGALVPLAADGLSPELLGRRLSPAAQPRLQAILDHEGPLRFAPDDPRPDPYDGLVLAAEGMNVHACMGSSLRVRGELVGVLTVDALDPTAFDHIDLQAFATVAALAAATLQAASLVERLEATADRRGRVNREMVADALASHGGQLLGRSAAMRHLEDEMAVVARTDLTVLLTGETGVGKELVARTLHEHSRRADQPLVYVNCAALPHSIAESELFGHVRGAFTGAVRDRCGKFELADGGTLFLDEIGELPLDIQSKLLRALQEGELQRVGSDQLIRADVRIIAATNRDLDAEVAAGRFRADVFHRLSVYPIHVPPLRDRVDDIALLAGWFLQREGARHGLGSVRLDASARAALEQNDWPGNVRELEHVIMRGVLRAARHRHDGEIVVTPHHLGAGEVPLHAALAPPTAVAACRLAAEPLPTMREAVDARQRELITRALEQAGGNWSDAARALELDRSNLHRLARRLGLR